MTLVRAPLAVYDGVDVNALRARIGAAQLTALDACGSTQDVAHEQAAAGAPHGAIVVAVRQEAGRGRTGKSWVSAAGAGVWTSIVVRPQHITQSGVLSLRVGLELADRLDAYAAAPVQLKWPNDLFLRGRKLAGILSEARWRGEQLEWIVVGVGVNVRDASDEVQAASLDATATCADVLVAVGQAVLQACAGGSVLSADECARYAARDLAVGRPITDPIAGTVQGITPEGGLRVATDGGERVAVAGSLVFRPL
jgi:BirA family biotin operon repressor/biotin-[acetyl-CoA-carboxylase] ligase